MTESAIRRALAAKGFRLKKTPARHWSRAEYGPGYMVIENYRNMIVLGCNHREYDGTLDDVIDWLSA